MGEKVARFFILSSTSDPKNKNMSTCSMIINKNEYILVEIGRVGFRVINLLLDIERVTKRRVIRPRILDLDRLTIIQVDSEKFQTIDGLHWRSTITIYDSS